MMTELRKMIHVAAAITVLGAMVPGWLSSQANAKPQATQAPKFVVDPLWPRPLPNHWILGSVVGVAVDARDHVFVLNIGDYFNQRTEIGAATTPATGECCTPAPPVLEFDPAGNFVAGWGGPGSGYTWPATPSGLSIDGNADIWVAANGARDTRILKFKRDGTFIAQFGQAGTLSVVAPTAGAADTAYAGAGGRSSGGGRGGRGAGPPPLPATSNSVDSFGGATKVSFDRGANEVYVADGSRNHRVAVMDASSGAIKRFWGAYGNKPVDTNSPSYAADAPAAKQFGAPVQCAEVSRDGLLYVCDRANDRIQVLRRDGTFVREKVLSPRTLGDGSVWDIAFSADAPQRFLYVADGMNMKVHVLDRQSLDVLSSFGDGGRQPGQFYGVHSIATDSKGNIYTGETYEGKRVQKFIFKGVAPVTKANAGVVWPEAAGKP